MARKPEGIESKTIGINMKEGLVDEIEKRAESMQISTSKYCKIILGEWLRSGSKLKLEER